MYFKYCEFLNRKSNNIPYVIIDFNNDYPSEKETKVYDLKDFINGAFDDILSTLNNILEFSNEFLDYEVINKEIWIKYQIENQIKIPRIGKEFKKAIVGEGNFEKHKYTTINYVKNKKTKELQFRSDKLFSKNLNLFETLENKYESYDLRIYRDSVCNDLEEVIYAFLECLFSSKIIYHIKRCKHCDNFFIAIKSDTKFCSKKHLINNEYITCSKIVAKLQKTYEYKELMKIDKNNLASIINNKKYLNVNIDEYKAERDHFKEKYFKTKNIAELDDFIKNYLSKI